MVGKEDEEESISWGQYDSKNTSRIYRSASWSPSDFTSNGLDNGNKDDGVDLTGSFGISCGQAQRFAPLTPRPNFKARSCLPPLQPLSIARRSLEEWPNASSDDTGEWPTALTPGGRDVSKGSERLKLDMPAIQRSSEKNGGLARKDKIAFFDKECSKMAEHVYLGGDAVAKNKDILKKNEITHVLNCVGFVCPEYFKADFVYRTLWLQDSPTEDITSILYDVFDYFEDVKEQNGKVFVHCCQGVSRSTSLVIAYLMWREGQSFDDAFQYVKEARSIADPNMGFACQLLQCQKRVHAIPLSPSSLLRMYKIAPHSPYDPLHLVPKMLNDPSLLALDSRGAFIIQFPSAMYIWVGKNCDIIIEREARGALSQIIRYERVDVPVHAINEGEEPPAFWDTFSKFVREKSSNGLKGDPSSSIPGERKVNLYDVDFEIFHKAIQGGFVPPASLSETDYETHVPARENSWSILRHKFASCHMKDFVLSPRLVIDRLYSDSLLNIGRDTFVLNRSRLSEFTSGTSSITSSPSSLSSPPYLSPNSISSDSSYHSNFSSESPSGSPVSLKPAVSSLSRLSLLSSQTDASVSNNCPGDARVNFASHHLTPTISSSKRPHLSLAERRGSFSKFLKMPIVSGDGSNCVEKKNDNAVSDVSCISFELEKGGRIIDSKDGNDCINHDSEYLVRSPGSCHEELTLASSDEVTQSYTLSKRPNVSMTTVSASCKHEQTLVYRLPSFDKIATLEARDLESSSAFLIMVQSTTSATDAKYDNIYLRFGRSFNFGQVQAQENTAVENVELVDWNQAGSDILSRMGLPEDTKIKFIKEGEESAEFLELLSTL